LYPASCRNGSSSVLFFAGLQGGGHLEYVIYILEDSAVLQLAVFKVSGQGLPKDSGGVFEALCESSPG
jgi:hypothetical protein